MVEMPFPKVKALKNKLPGGMIGHRSCSILLLRKALAFYQFLKRQNNSFSS